MCGALNLMAQKIDFNFNKSEAEVHEPDYIAWQVNKSATDSKTLDNGVTITLSAAGGADIMQTQWHKNTCQAGQRGQTGLRLLGDGVMAFKLDATNNTPNLTNVSTAIKVAIEGLSAGRHSILAYHVHKDPKTGEMPLIKVEVNGEEKLTNVVFGNVMSNAAELKMSNATASYVEFTVADGEKVELTYSTIVEEGKTYQTTNVMLNGLVFDTTPYLAQDPIPDNKDYHVDADNGSYTLQWTPASVAVSHKLVLGTDAEAVEQATTYQYEGEATSYTVSNLKSWERYYWRVDEVEDNGTVHKGQVWSFQPRQLAFPGAEGYGRFARGGRGGVVYHVTSLSGDKDTPGTLTYGLVNLEGPRYIVFDVSGIIELDFDSYFTKPYATIAGQTAPGKGICIKKSNINIGSDVICRHVRFKRGLGTSEQTGNAMGMTGADHAIVDHCTAAWGTDETVSGRGAKNISFQYSIITEALGEAEHKNYPSGTNHGYAATIDGQRGSWHHNLLANCAGRNWSMGGGMAADNMPIGGLDLFNNVCYNWWSRTTDGNCHEVNFVGNYYKMGPDTRKKTLFTQDFEEVINPNGFNRAYINGNIRENKDHSLTKDAKNDTYNATGRIPTTYDYVVSEPLFPSYATIHSAKDAMKIVTSYAGATMPMRDDQHVRNVRETLNGTYTYVGSKSGIKGEIDNEADITEHTNGWEVYPEEKRDADWDTDQDGMPDWFEKVIGSDPLTANQNDDPDKDGWTLLEDYFEFMAHPYLIVAPNSTQTIDVKPYFMGFYGQNGHAVTPIYSVATASNLFTPSVDGSVITAQTGAAGGVGYIDVTVNDGETTFTQRIGVAVTGETTGIHTVWSEANIDVAKREFFTLDGKQVSQMQSHGVYIMKLTDTKGNVHTVKIIKN